MLHKAELSMEKSRWLETLGSFGIFPLALKHGKIHVFGDLFSKTQKVEEEAVLNNIEVSLFALIMF